MLSTVTPLPCNTSAATETSAELQVEPALNTPSCTTFFKAWNIFTEIVSDQNVEVRLNPLARAIKEVDTYLADDILPMQDENQKFNCQLEWWIKHLVYPNMSTQIWLNIFKQTVLSLQHPCHVREYSQKVDC